MSVCVFVLFSTEYMSLSYSYQVCCLHGSNVSVCLCMYMPVCVCQPGEEFYVDNCKEKCRCDVSIIRCEESECPPKEECKLQDGELGCYPTSKFTPTTQQTKR